MKMKIAIGSDSYGFALKEAVKKHLDSLGYVYHDYGIRNADEETPYYNTADEVAKQIVTHKFDRGVLVCGTGMGMSIIANKHRGIYAAICENTFAAEKSRSINNSNILTLGGMITDESTAKDIVDIWLKTEFTEGWEPSIQKWLRNSMDDISTIEGEQFLG
jgi:ribose 5-phosphate isomerase B